MTVLRRIFIFLSLRFLLFSFDQTEKYRRVESAYEWRSEISLKAWVFMMLLLFSFRSFVHSFFRCRCLLDNMLLLRSSFFFFSRYVAADVASSVSYIIIIFIINKESSSCDRFVFIRLQRSALKFTWRVLFLFMFFVVVVVVVSFLWRASGYLHTKSVAVCDRTQSRCDKRWDNNVDWLLSSCMRFHDT